MKFTQTLTIRILLRYRCQWSSPWMTTAKLVEGGELVFRYLASPWMLARFSLNEDREFLVEWRWSVSRWKKMECFASPWCWGRKRWQRSTKERGRRMRGLKDESLKEERVWERVWNWEAWERFWMRREAWGWELKNLSFNELVRDFIAVL